MSTARLLVGDVFDRLAELPDGSVDLVMTSPPFLALRSYLPADHPNKAKEIGSEATPAEFIDTLLALTAEWGRVLAPHGSLCVELGDTYAGSGGAGGDYNESGLRDGQPRFRQERNRPRDTRSGRNGTATAATPRPEQPGGAGWPLDKSLTGIPTLYAWSLAYGRNLLTGEPSPAGQWRIRNLVAWVRPNPPVGALGDRDRWFDLDAVRTAGVTPSGHPRGPKTGGATEDHRDTLGEYVANPAGAPPLDWWNIPPRGFQGSHYAVYPPELCERPIEAMCPRRVCTTCGQPSRRISEASYEAHSPNTVEQQHAMARGQAASGTSILGVDSSFKHGRATKHVETTGWSTCGCPGTDGLRLDGYHTGTGWRPGHVLDPFGGSGTTAAVATGHGRDCTLIDLDERNADLVRERLGMFLDVDHGTTAEAS